MSLSKYFTTFIFVFGFIECECVIKIASCHENTVSYEWQPNNTSAPATLSTIDIYDVPETSKIFGKLVIDVIKRRENFNLTVLLKPFVENQSQCPPDPNTETNLRRFHLKDRFMTDIGNGMLSYYPKASTGCYYFIMTNDKNQHWLTGPEHLKSNYVPYDTMLQCNVTEFNATVGSKCDRARLKISFRIPMKCLKLQFKLFELQDQNPDTLEKCESGEIPAKKVCWVSLNHCNGTKAIISLTCEKSSENTTLQILQQVDPTCEMDNSWKVHVYWKGLRAAGAYYYSTFSQVYSCAGARFSHLNTWLPATKLHIIDHHWKNDTDNECVVPKISPEKFNVNIIYITMGVALILILIYWIGKCIRNSLSQNKSSWKESNVIASAPEEAWLCNVQKSTDILLIYARDSDKFTKAVDHLRNNLKQKYSYQIRDIYSDNELQNVSKLTVSVWIEKIMKNGCKIIWIDTPKFRSRLNDDNLLNEENLNYDGRYDFRDTSVRYAVNLAKTTLENITQYCCHFILRIDGFDEFNGVEDPLHTITHYVRYQYPEHIDDLCERLNK